MSNNPVQPTPIPIPPMPAEIHQTEQRAQDWLKQHEDVPQLLSRKHLSLGKLTALLFLVVTLPLMVLVVKQRQDIRPFAATWSGQDAGTKERFEKVWGKDKAEEQWNRERDLFKATGDEQNSGLWGGAKEPEVVQQFWDSGINNQQLSESQRDEVKKVAQQAQEQAEQQGASAKDAAATAKAAVQDLGAPGVSPPGGTGVIGGTAASCYDLGNNQTERDCLAGATSGTYTSGQCRGLSVAACAALGRAVYCSGNQEAAGSARAGEFLDCGKSSTGGCGQVDVYDANNNLIGFVIDKTGCGGTAPTTVTPAAPPREISPPTDGGGPPPPTPTPPPPPPPPPAAGVVCGSLGKDVGAPELNQTVVFTCTGNFSAVDPVYEFRHRVNSGSYTVVAGTPNADKTRATTQVTINQAGTWETQCRVCTDASKTSCTTWGQAQ